MKASREQLAQAVKDLRRMHGWSQGALGRKLGRCTQTIQRYEGRGPSGAALVKLAALATGTPLETLFLQAYQEWIAEGAELRAMQQGKRS
jgi:transcriptional regulator with XRE-family HTH domain